MRFFFINLSGYDLTEGLGHTVILPWLSESRHHAFYLDSRTTNPQERLANFIQEFQRLSWDEQKEDSSLFFFISKYDTWCHEEWMCKITADFYPIKVELKREIKIRCIFLEPTPYHSLKIPRDIPRFDKAFLADWKPVELWKQGTNDEMTQDEWIKMPRVKSFIRGFRILNWNDTRNPQFRERTPYYLLKVFFFVHCLIEKNPIYDILDKDNNEQKILYRVLLHDLNETQLSFAFNKLKQQIKVYIQGLQNSDNALKEKITLKKPENFDMIPDWFNPDISALLQVHFWPFFFAGSAGFDKEWYSYKTHIEKDIEKLPKVFHDQYKAAMKSMIEYEIGPGVEQVLSIKELDKVKENYDILIIGLAEKLSDFRKDLKSNDEKKPTSILSFTNMDLMPYWETGIQEIREDVLEFLRSRFTVISYNKLFFSVLALCFISACFTMIAFFKNYLWVAAGAAACFYSFLLAGLCLFWFWFKPTRTRLRVRLNHLHGELQEIANNTKYWLKKQIHTLTCLKILNNDLDEIKRKLLAMERKKEIISYHQNYIETLDNKLDLQAQTFGIQIQDDFTSDKLEEFKPDSLKDNVYLKRLSIQLHHNKTFPNSSIDGTTQEFNDENSIDSLFFFKEIKIESEPEFR